MLHCGQVIRWRGSEIWNWVSHLITSVYISHVAVGQNLTSVFQSLGPVNDIYTSYQTCTSSLSNVGFRANWAVRFIDTIFHFIDCVYFFISPIRGFVDCFIARSLSCFSIPFSGYLWTVWLYSTHTNVITSIALKSIVYVNCRFSVFLCHPNSPFWDLNVL